jgi:hypothetical protein
MTLHRPLRLFALIIGINKYKSPNITNLRISSSQIRILLESEATRAAIIDGIKAFSLYFDLLCRTWRRGRYARGLGSWRHRQNRASDSLRPLLFTGRWRSPKYGIPDRTLGALLSRLAIEKGDNIVRPTFILCGFIN